MRLPLSSPCCPPAQHIDTGPGQKLPVRGSKRLARDLTSFIQSLLPQCRMWGPDVKPALAEGHVRPLR